MKVIFVAPRYHTNQVAAVQALQSAGHEVEFHVNRIGETEDHNLLIPQIFSNGTISKLCIYLFGDGGGDCKWHAPGILKYFVALRESAAEAVVIRNPKRLFSVIAAVSARLQRRKILFYTQTPLHSCWGLHKRVAARTLMFLFGAAWMTPLSGNTNQGSPIKGMVYVPFPISSKGGRGEGVTRRPGPTLRLLMVGKYNERKNAALLIDAIAESKLDFQLTIIGECCTEAQRQLRDELEQQLKSLDLTERVILQNSVPFERMPLVYRQHDVFVLPARNEPASISVLEAIASGMPSICSDTCGTACYIRPGRTGFVFASDDKASLITNLKAVANMFSEQSCDSIARQCLESASKDFSAQVYINAFMSSLQKP